jgi:hypothetical protein
MASTVDADAYGAAAARWVGNVGCAATVSAMNNQGTSGAFDTVVRTLPGADYIGDKWRNEPRVLVHLCLSQDHWAVTAATDEFPSAQVAATSGTGWERRLVLCVPHFVASVLEMYASFDHDGTLTNFEKCGFDDPGTGIDVFIPSLSALPAAEVVELVAWCAVDENMGSLDDAVNAADDVAELAATHTTTWQTIRELIADVDSIDIDAFDALLCAAFG